MPSRSITFVLPSEFATIERMVDEAQSFFSAHVEDEDAAYNLVLLASEAVTNGVEHGNRFDDDKKVTVTFECDNGRAMICVTDEGGGFIPGEVPDPMSVEHMMADRGRGLFLMEQIADEVRFEEKGRRVVLIVNLA